MTKQHWIGALAAFACGFGWMAVCWFASWPIVGAAGVVVGIIVGGAFYAVLLDHADPPAGLVAAVVAMALVVVGGSWPSASQPAAESAQATGDAALIESLAEQIVWRRGDHSPDEAIARIPADALAEAEREWNAMPAEQQQKMRAVRERWTTVASSGGAQDAGAPALSSRFAVGALAGVVAMCIAAWPAIVQHYVRRATAQ